MLREKETNTKDNTFAKELNRVAIIAGATAIRAGCYLSNFHSNICNGCDGTKKCHEIKERMDKNESETGSRQVINRDN